MPGFDKFDDLKRDDLHLRTTGEPASESLVPASAHAVSAEKLVGETIDGRYQLLSIIGEGGMGRVYKAKQLLTGRIVALKMLPTRNTSDAMHLMRFQQEAKAACAINHPNAVSVYEFGVTPDHVPYLAMQYVEGPTLSEEIAHNGPLKESFALQIFEQIADALESAHERRVLHRDIKPSNIMLVPDKKTGRRAMLLDFGIAKVENETDVNLNLTKTGEVFGTPFYMSPEQCQGAKLDLRSDIYSLGCVMYESLAGHPPFSGDNFLQIVYRQVHENPPSLAESIRNKPVSEELQDIVSKCLEKDPADRFQSAAQLRNAIETLRKPPVTAHVGKDRKQVVIASVISVLCLAFAGYTFWTQHPIKELTWSELYGQALTEMKQDRWDKAKVLLDKAIELIPPDSPKRSILIGLMERDARHDLQVVSDYPETSRRIESDHLQQSELLDNCVNAGQSAEMLYREQLHYMPSKEEGAVQDREYELAQLYAALANCGGLNFAGTEEWSEKAEQLYEMLKDPSDPAVYHEHGTFLIIRAGRLDSQAEALSADAAAVLNGRAYNYRRQATEELARGADRYKTLLEQKSDDNEISDLRHKIAGCHFWSGIAYNGMKQYDKAESEYQTALQYWNDSATEIPTVYNNQIYNYGCWAQQLEKGPKPDTKGAKDLRVKATKLADIVQQRAKKSKE